MSLGTRFAGDETEKDEVEDLRGSRVVVEGVYLLSLLVEVEDADVGEVEGVDVVEVAQCLIRGCLALIELGEEISQSFDEMLKCLLVSVKWHILVYIVPALNKEFPEYNGHKTIMRDFKTRLRCARGQV